MTELIQIAVVIIIAITVFTDHWQNKSIEKQQAQIEQLRATITEYMYNMSRFVEAQDEANRAMMATIITISEDNNEKL